MSKFITAGFACLLLTGAVGGQAQAIDARTKARIDRILKATPLIDGHNDLPEQLAENYGRSVAGLASGTDQRRPSH